ncbi:hypothetical protein RB653_004620 [Dictyostelium firmibasis]|uniref:Small GTPase n=1 Tax=Dictyostelium firmibasis TaxID=79012 RepID=A0AAN7U830_9MYCE
MLKKYLMKTKDVYSVANQKKEVKICVLGDANVGKTNFINQFTKSSFNEDYTPTIESRQNKLFKFSGKQYQIQIYDTAGSKELNLFVSDSISQCEGFIIIYSLTDRNSILRIQHYKTLIKNIFKEVEMPIVLVGTKMDLNKQIAITKNECKTTSFNHNIPNLFFTSAKSKESIVPVFKKLVDMIVLKERKVKKETESNNIRINHINQIHKQKQSQQLQQQQQTIKNQSNNEKLKARLDNKPRSASTIRMKKYLKLF